MKIHHSSSRLASACAIALLLPSCGLIRAPFKIVGNVAGGTYRAGTDLVDSTRTAMDERKKRKEQEKAKAEALAEKEAAAKKRNTPMAGPTADPSAILPVETVPIEPLSDPGANPDTLPPLPDLGPADLVPLDPPD